MYECFQPFAFTAFNTPFSQKARWKLRILRYGVERVQEDINYLGFVGGGEMFRIVLFSRFTVDSRSQEKGSYAPRMPLTRSPTAPRCLMLEMRINLWLGTAVFHLRRLLTAPTSFDLFNEFMLIIRIINGTLCVRAQIAPLSQTTMGDDFFLPGWKRNLIKQNKKKK